MHLQINQCFLQAIERQFGKRYFYLLFNSAKRRLEFWTSGIDLVKKDNIYVKKVNTRVNLCTDCQPDNGRDKRFGIDGA